MIPPETLYDALLAAGVEFFTGVPDSLLGPFCNLIQERHPPERHVIAANEGSAVGLATGFHLATGSVPAVYMQNSGLGNAVNPLVSLNDPAVYGIPLLLIIGWRAEISPNGEQLVDEPQHRKQGRVTQPLLDALEIPHRVLQAQTSAIEPLVNQLVASARERGGPVALVVRRGTFVAGGKLSRQAGLVEKPLSLSREEAIAQIARRLPPDAAVVATTGKASRELFEHREATATGHERDFLVCGSMGHASQIATGIALAQPNRTVCCFDGDGAALMHLGGLATSAAAPNLVHVLLNNGCHESVGGQPTRGWEIDFPAMARALGYASTDCVRSRAEIDSVWNRLTASDRGAAAFLEIQVLPGSRSNLGRPTLSPPAMRDLFRRHLTAANSSL